jgi:putative transposase
MPRKRHMPEEIVTKPRQVDVLVSQGQSIVDAIRTIGVTEVNCAMSYSTARSSTH